jgi:hypothetical protein
MLRQAKEERRLKWMSGAAQLKSDLSDSGRVAHLGPVVTIGFEGATATSTIDTERL